MCDYTPVGKSVYLVREATERQVLEKCGEVGSGSRLLDVKCF